MAAEETVNFNLVAKVPTSGSGRRFMFMVLGVGLGQSVQVGKQLSFTLMCPVGMIERRFCLGETDVLTCVEDSDDLEYREFEVRTVANLLVGTFRHYKDRRGLVFVP